MKSQNIKFHLINTCLICYLPTTNEIFSSPPSMSLTPNSHDPATLDPEEALLRVHKNWGRRHTKTQMGIFLNADLKSKGHKTVHLQPHFLCLQYDICPNGKAAKIRPIASIPDLGFGAYAKRLMGYGQYKPSKKTLTQINKIKCLYFYHRIMLLVH